MKTLMGLLCMCLLSFTVAAAEPPTKGKVFHVVSFKYNSEVTEAQKTEISNAFAALKTKISQIVSLDYGTNVSPEKLNRGFTHMYVLTFNNEADRDIYLKHPEHAKFGKLLGGKLADQGVFVLDFVSQ